MRWLSDRSNSARDEIATTSLSASVGLGMRHPSAQPLPWLWRRAENGAFLEPSLGAHLLRFRRVDNVSVPYLGDVVARTVEADDGGHSCDALTARWQHRPEGQAFVAPVRIALDERTLRRV